MKSYIPNQSPPFDRKAEREPRHRRKEQQPKHPKRPSKADRFAPWNAAGQREWNCKQQHQGSPQPQSGCHHRHFASDASVAARPVHVTVNALKSSLSKQAWSAYQRQAMGQPVWNESAFFWHESAETGNRSCSSVVNVLSLSCSSRAHNTDRQLLDSRLDVQSVVWLSGRGLIWVNVLGSKPRQIMITKWQKRCGENESQRGTS